MFIFFLIIAIIGVLVLTIHLTVEANGLEKSVRSLSEELVEHYGFKRSSSTDQSNRSQS